MISILLQKQSTKTLNQDFDILSKISNFFYNELSVYKWAEKLERQQQHIVKHLNLILNNLPFYETNLDSSTISTMLGYYNEILERLYKPQGLNDTNEQVKKEMLMFVSAYTLMEQLFFGKKREQHDGLMKSIDYFEHLKGTMEILLREMPEPNITVLIIALLHDSLEDIPGYKKSTIKAIYGEFIAAWIQQLSKKHWERYLSEEEYDNYLHALYVQKKKLRKVAKQRRNEDYFGHMDQLNPDYFKVKCADRIHNLRTLDGLKHEKILRKIHETEVYFLPIAKTKLPVAYDLMKNEIDRLKEKYIR